MPYDYSVRSSQVLSEPAFQTTSAAVITHSNKPTVVNIEKLAEHLKDHRTRVSQEQMMEDFLRSGATEEEELEAYQRVVALTLARTSDHAELVLKSKAEALEALPDLREREALLKNAGLESEASILAWQVNACEEKESQCNSKLPELTPEWFSIQDKRHQLPSLDKMKKLVPDWPLLESPEPLKQALKKHGDLLRSVDALVKNLKEHFEIAQADMGGALTELTGKINQAFEGLDLKALSPKELGTLLDAIDRNAEATDESAYPLGPCGLFVDRLAAHFSRRTVLTAQDAALIKETLKHVIRWSDREQRDRAFDLLGSVLERALTASRDPYDTEVNRLRELKVLELQSALENHKAAAPFAFKKNMTPHFVTLILGPTLKTVPIVHRGHVFQTLVETSQRVGMTERERRNFLAMLVTQCYYVPTAGPEQETYRSDVKATVQVEAASLPYEQQAELACYLLSRACNAPMTYGDIALPLAQRALLKLPKSDFGHCINAVLVHVTFFHCALMLKRDRLPPDLIDATRNVLDSESTRMSKAQFEEFGKCLKGSVVHAHEGYQNQVEAVLLLMKQQRIRPALDKSQ